MAIVAAALMPTAYNEHAKLAFNNSDLCFDTGHSTFDSRRLSVNMRDAALDRDEPCLERSQFLGSRLRPILINLGSFESRIRFSQHQSQIGPTAPG